MPPHIPVQGKLLYAQSGGVTAVINATAAGVIETARAHGVQVYAARHGIVGALREELVDTSKESETAIAALRHTPGGAFGSCRYKLKSLQDDRSQYTRLIDVCQAHNIRWFLYNGGNDSADTALKLSQMGETLGYDLRCIGVPKTVDNDLVMTDCCPGFGSVAKYTALSTLEVGLDVASMAETSTRVFIMEVMGRNSGWIAAAAGLAGHGPDDAPHIILFPERTFNKDAFLAKVKATVERVGWCVVVSSEGIRNAAGQLLSDNGSRDAFGHAQLGGVAPMLAALIKKELGYKYHWALPDYLQRAARHTASRVDVEQAYAVGKAAVNYALDEMNAVMPVIVRDSDTPYRWKITPAPLKAIANHEKKVPEDFISADGFGITEAARRYLRPLIADEAPPPYSADGLPQYVQLRHVRVPAKLPAFTP